MALPGCSAYIIDIVGFGVASELRPHNVMSGSTSNLARRPDVKKKLVVVGDGAQDTLFILLAITSLLRRLWKDMFTHSLRGKPISRGMYASQRLEVFSLSEA